MARRRYISTQISLDPAVNRLAVEYGDFAALLYTWMIPHADDDATLTGDPEKLLFMVVPGRRDKTTDDVVAALEGMERLGLIEWDREMQTICFPPESFYRYQTYINTAKRRNADSSAKRRKTPTNADDRQGSAQKATSPSPSPSPSPSLSLSNTTPPTPPLSEGNSKPERENATKPGTPAYELATILRSAILERDSTTKVPALESKTFASWVTEADRLLRIDERPLDEALRLARWCQQDDFWCANILSMAKFRKQYDKLKRKAQSAKPRASPSPKRRVVHLLH